MLYVYKCTCRYTFLRLVVGLSIARGSEHLYICLGQFQSVHVLLRPWVSMYPCNVLEISAPTNLSAYLVDIQCITWHFSSLTHVKGWVVCFLSFMSFSNSAHFPSTYKYRTCILFVRMYYHYIEINDYDCVYVGLYQYMLYPYRGPPHILPIRAQASMLLYHKVMNINQISITYQISALFQWCWTASQVCHVLE